jgi:hypothetical protein
LLRVPAPGDDRQVMASDRSCRLLTLLGGAALVTARAVAGDWPAVAGNPAGSAGNVRTAR